MQTLDVGEVATLSSRWWDGTNAAAEPSAIDLTITKPDGTVIAKVKVDLTGSASGAPPAGTLDVWAYGQVVDLPGIWRYVFEGLVDGAVVTQDEQVFLVDVTTTSSNTPCEPWCTWEEVTACVAEGLLDALPMPAREVAIDMASEIVYNLDERKYSGICTTTRNLCRACRTCYPTWCSCDQRNGIDLALTPVWGIISVVVDGVTLDPSEYAVTQRRYLSRIDNAAWPSSSDVRDDAAFRVSWAHGRPVPLGGRRAAALFAAEIAKGCLALECAIPQRITSIVREGVTYPILDSLSMIKEGRTGVALTDLWIVADLKGAKMKPGMYSPGAYGSKVSHG